MKRSIIALILCISMILPMVSSCIKLGKDTSAPDTDAITDSKPKTEIKIEDDTHTDSEPENEVENGKGSANLNSTVVVYDNTYTKKIENSIIAPTSRKVLR